MFRLQVRPLVGQRVRLQASAQGVLLTADDGSAAPAGIGAAGGSNGSGAAKPKASGGAIQKASRVLLRAHMLEQGADCLCLDCVFLGQAQPGVGRGAGRRPLCKQPVSTSRTAVNPTP